MINLPSEGVFYKNRKKSLLIRYLTAIEESVLTDGILNESGKAIEMVLNDLIIDNDIEARDLLMCDIQAILIFLRSTAYGDSVELDFKCPNCKNTSKVNLVLSALDWKTPEYKPSKSGEYVIELPNSDIQLKTRPLFFRDELEKEEDDDFLEIKDGSSIIKIKRESTNKIASFVTEINGETSKTKIKKIIRNLPKSSVLLLKDFFKNNELGVSEENEFTCEYCQEKTKTSIPFGYNFLSLPSEYKKNILEEVFLLTYYGKNVSFESAYKMPVFQRRWHINRIQEELEKKHEAEKGAVERAKSKGKR